MQVKTELSLRRCGGEWIALCYNPRFAGEYCSRPDDALRSLACRMEQELPDEIYGPEHLWQDGRPISETYSNETEVSNV